MYSSGSFNIPAKIREFLVDSLKSHGVCVYVGLCACGCRLYPSATTREWKMSILLLRVWGKICGVCTRLSVVLKREVVSAGPEEASVTAEGRPNQ